jgi:hypothetical protein
MDGAPMQAKKGAGRSNARDTAQKRAFKKREPLDSSAGEKPEKDLTPVEIADAVADITMMIIEKMGNNYGDGVSGVDAILMTSQATKRETLEAIKKVVKKTSFGSIGTALRLLGEALNNYEE